MGTINNFPVGLDISDLKSKVNQIDLKVSTKSPPFNSPDIFGVVTLCFSAVHIQSNHLVELANNHKFS